MSDDPRSPDWFKLTNGADFTLTPGVMLGGTTSHGCGKTMLNLMLQWEAYRASLKPAPRPRLEGPGNRHERRARAVQERHEAGSIKTQAIHP